MYSHKINFNQTVLYSLCDRRIYRYPTIYCCCNVCIEIYLLIPSERLRTSKRKLQDLYSNLQKPVSPSYEKIMLKKLKMIQYHRIMDLYDDTISSYKSYLLILIINFNYICYQSIDNINKLYYKLSIIKPIIR